MDVERWTLDVGCLQTGDAALIQHIRKAIQAHGPVSFAWFMEQALYHPQHGYYSSGRCTIGRRGDYYTSVSVGPLFGRLLAAQFEEMWRVLGRPNEFKIVEQGAHDGQLARDVLEATREHYPDLFAALRYEIVEPLPTLRARQAETLSPFKEQVGWSDGLQQVAPFCGVHFSNELLDAMPVHLVKWSGTEWLERHVARARRRLRADRCAGRGHCAGRAVASHSNAFARRLRNRSESGRTGLGRARLAKANQRFRARGRLRLRA